MLEYAIEKQTRIWETIEGLMRPFGRAQIEWDEGGSAEVLVLSTGIVSDATVACGQGIA